MVEIDLGLVPSEVRVENLDGGSARYPHIYGAVPLEAVTATYRLTKGPSGWALPAALSRG